MNNDKLYVLLSTRPESTHDRPLVIKMSFDRQELERTKAAIEAQAKFWAPRLEVALLDDQIAERYWPESNKS